MGKYPNRVVILVLLVVMFGCAAPLTQPSFSDQRLRVHNSLNKKVVFESLIENVNKGGFTEFQLSGFNNSKTVLKIEYQITWFDSSGIAIKSILSRWNKQTLVNGMPFQIRGVSPRTGVSSLLIQVKKDGDGEFEQVPENSRSQG